MKKITVIFFAVMLTGSIFAGQIKIEITSYGPVSSSILNPLVDQLATNINTGFLDSYMKGMSNAAVAATRGTGVDYVPNMGLFTVGFGMGIGIDLGEDGSLDDLSKATGVGVYGGFLLGLNLKILTFLPEIGPIDLKKSKFYVNVLSMDIPPDIKENLTGSVSTFGMHLQNKIIDPVMGKVKWYGVDVSTGMDYSLQKYHYVYSLKETANYSGAGASIQGSIPLDAEVKAFTIPIEASTSIGLLWILNIYAGAGVDWNIASAKSIISTESNANINAPITFSGGAAGASAKASLYPDEGNADTMDLRLFVGTQLDFSILKLDVQYQRNITNNAMAVNFGTRINW